MDETSGDAEGKAGGGGVEEDMEVGECSEEEEDEEEDIDLGSSPITDTSSVIINMASPAPTAYEGLASPLRVVPGVISGGKPVGIKRGPGRPRGPGSRGGSAGAMRAKKPSNQPPKLKRWKGLLVSGACGGSNGKTPGENGEEESTSPIQPSTPVEQKTPIFVDEPLFTEQWPGKVCVLCNLTEHSQLGQGKMCRVECTVEELPKEIPKELTLRSPPETPPIDATSPRHQAQLFQNRRQKGMSKFRNSHGGGQEPVDELSLVGHNDAPEANHVVDAGYIYIHEWCAVWCAGITKKHGHSFQNVPAAVMAAVTRRCYHCSRYGAGSACIVPSCNKHFHTPCAAAAATFQYVKSMILICSQHIDQVETNSTLSEVICYTCNNLGNVSNLVMCSMCGKHHHGVCIGNALQPGLRAGWQCGGCRLCQLCRQSEDTSRMLVCDSCDKAYHPFCVRPAMSSVPKVGWKCKRCRLCSDCGARTPGGGLSSRWHSNYTVCDSCYQQRNKGFSCPVCHKAYRAAALREMVRCSQCQRFVHGTCDKEADFVSYHRKKDTHPDYEYICLSCKNNSTVHYMKRKDSTEELQLDSSLSVSQESLMANDDADGDSERSDDASMRFSIGLGKGKPFYASKIAKKRLGLSVGPGRPKGSGKLPSITSNLNSFQKKHRFADFGRKKGSKTKIRGMFGVPGLALQSPTWSSSDAVSKSDDEPGCENKIILCASKEKFVLSQDVCVMCGAMGIDQEACLICCSQCGQCYHPYCVTVKVTKVMLSRGWRCLDCTVCEGCGQRNDEARLILCDDCDISYHIYCMDPPMGAVPTGGWKCKWCAQCLTCGATTPGINATWQSNFSQCGACASRTTCPACLELYTDGDLIIKCINCDRWLHCLCDTITTEQEAEAYCAQGYTCVLCRPSNVPLAPPVTPTRVPSPDLPIEGKANDYYVDGVCLSETGLHQIKTLSLENNNPPVRRKRPGFKRSQESDILNLEDGDNDNAPSNTVYKDGMVWGSKENGPVPSPPEGFSLYTSDTGVVILKRKKQRNLQKLGIGGFSAVKMRSSRFKDDEEGLNPFGEDKPRRKPRCNKKRSKLAESYPSYLQEAFFGRELLDITKESTQELESSSEESDGEKPKVSQDKTISLSQDELKVMADANAKKEELSNARSSSPCISVKEEDMSDSENFKDILHLPDNLLHNDLVNTIMNERDSIKSEIDSGTHDSNANQKDELSEILGPNFSLESMVRETGLPNMDSKDVEEIFKGVLTHESQDTQSPTPLVSRGPTPGTPSQNQVSPQQQGLPPNILSRSGNVTPATVHSNLPSPMGFPSASPYNSEYSNSPQFSPDGSPWGGDDIANSQRNSLRMEQDEALGQHATIAAVLYANINHPEFKQEFPSWSERSKQIIKKWRQLQNEKRAPYVQLAKENRSNVRIKKTQQIGKEEAEEDGSNEKQTPSGGKTFEEQEKTQINKTSREAEQERWKQMQALRQQQLFAQNRAIPRIARQLSSDGSTLVQYSTETSNNPAPATQQLLVSTPQEPVVNSTLGTLGSPRNTQFTTPAGLKTVRQALPGTVFARGVLRPPTPAASPFSPPRQPVPEEMNRQLRDLLKGQHVKQETNLGDNNVLSTTSASGQLRTQLALTRPPQTLQQANVPGVMDARVRYHLLQQSRPNFPGSALRLAAPRQLEHLNAVVQRQPFVTASATPAGATIVRTSQQQLVVEHPGARLQNQLDPRIAATRDGEEIPDSVTAELEKLEQEGGSISEAEAVSAILGDLVEDDDDALLAEMGADFNILAYADPELDDITDGDKTNLHIPHLDDLEDEVEKKKQMNANEPKAPNALQQPCENKPPVKEENVQPTQLVLPNRTPPTSRPVSVVTTNMISSASVNSQGNLTLNHVLPSNKDKTFTPFVTPTTPLPRMQLMPGAITPPRPQPAGTPVPGGKTTSFIQISPPPPYPGPPPPYPGQIQSSIRVGGPKVARSALPPLSAAAPQRSLLLQEQPLLLEDLLEEEKREQEQRSNTPVQGPSSGTSLMSDADFEMLRAEVLLGAATTQVSSPPQISSVPLLNIPIQPAPPPPPDNIVTEQDRQIQIQYEQWLQSNNAAVTHQLKYYETEVQKLRKLRKSLNSRQRQLRKNGGQLPPKDAVELQRVQGETTALQKHLEAARKQSRTHTIVMQEYQNKQEQKNGGITSSVITANVIGPQNSGSTSPQSPSGLISPSMQQQQMLPSPQTSASPLHHSPRIGTPHSQSGDDKSENGLSSPRPPPMAPTPPSPHQFHQIRHPGMVPRFARSPEGQPRPRLILQSAQGTANLYSAPRAFVTSTQNPNISQQSVVASRPTPQHQQLLIQRHQLLQQKRELLLQRQQEVLQQEGLLPRQLQEGVQRQVLLRQGILTEEPLGVQDQQAQQQLQQQQAQQQLQQQQLQALQRQQLQNRQQIIMSQQGKVGQYRQLIQQQSSLIQVNQLQSPTSLNQQFAASSPVPPSPMQSPSPISTPLSNTPQYSTSSSPLHPPPSPMLSQFQNPASSPMPQQSPRVQNFQTANSPMTPQSPMVYSGLQTPTSPMPQFNQPNSPMPPHSPRVQPQYGQPPSSPMGGNAQNSMMQQQFVHRPNSPMVSLGSPMPMRRPSSTGGSIASSPAADRPQSVEPRTPQDQDAMGLLSVVGGNNGGGGGGGNPYNPHIPIPFPPDLFRHGYVKLGLRGGSPMWNDKALPRKPLLKGKVGQPSPGTSANNADEKSRKSLVCADYNDFDEESTPPTTPPIRPASIKKSSDNSSIKTRQSEDTDSELTVYDDIVLVDGCKEGNLEVEELQSALENSVMSTVVSMPMMIDDPDILDDCLVSSSDLVVLDVDSGNNENDCILEVVGKDDNMLLLDDDMTDGLKVEEDLIELDEDMPPSPVGRKRFSGKVLPGKSIPREEEKTFPESPDDSSMSTIADRSEPVTSSGEEKINSDEKKSDDSSTTPDSLILDRNLTPTSVQPNVVVSRNAVAFTPISTQKSIPVCSERSLSKQQAAIASLVQGAVNAAKLAAAEAQHSQKSSTETSTPSTTHIFSRPLNIVSGGRGPQSQYLSSAVITNKIENQLAGCSEVKKDGKTLKLERSFADLSPSKSDTRFFQDNITQSSVEQRNRIAEFLKNESPTEPEDSNKSFKRTPIILKFEENNDGESSNKLSFRLDNSINTVDRIGAQNNSSMILNIVGDKPMMNTDNDFKFGDRNKLTTLSDSTYNTSRPEQVTLPAVSSSILEAQLTSMLRSSSSDHPSGSGQKIIYAIVNHNNKDVMQPREDVSPHDDMKVEGLAAHFQRTIKTEAEVRMTDEVKTISNFKTGLHAPAKMKSDSFIVSGTHYKLYTGRGENMINTPEETKSINQNHFLNKTVESTSNNHHQVVVKQEPGLSLMNKAKVGERFISGDVLQQRIVSSSEISQLFNDKDALHLNIGGNKGVPRDDQKKLVSVGNVLLSRRESEENKGNIRMSRTPDDSQNVLLKQLLQNTASATSTSTSSPQPPSLPIVPSLEAQLARPVPPTPSSLIPPLLNEPPRPPSVKEIPVSPQTPKPSSVPHTPTTPESSRAPSTVSCLDELLSPPPQPPSSTSQQVVGTPIIKREPMMSSLTPQTSSPMTSPIDVKKENIPLNVPVDVEVKKEVMSSDEMLSPGLRTEQETSGDPSLDIKKLKRRQYQQKRRQSLGKEAVGGTPKKRPRKSSKVEEDYDSFIDSLMLQLRQLPATMSICEPNLTYNFTGSPLFGSGDLTKVNSSTRLGELRGTYGTAYLPHENDYYNTIPFGDIPPKAPSAPSTQRGFYNEEFAPLKLHATKDEFDDRKYDYNRDSNDTPDTIVSSSSPECIMPEFPTQYPGLQFIDSDSEDERQRPSRFSPDIPLISPLIVRPKPIRFYSDMDKENEGPQNKKHCDNVTVTLTLNSQAADDILSVLRNLANVLRIPVPVHYSITERMNKPSHRLGMCKIRSKDGKEGGQVDIQSILNGSTKFCRHCEVVITNNLMRKRASDLPLVAKQGEEELYFCSTACYMQLSLAHPAPVLHDKADTLVEHHGEIPPKKTKIVCDPPNNKCDAKREKSLNEVPPFMSTRNAGKRESRQSIDKALAPPVKKSVSRFRVWTSMTIPPPSTRYKKPTDKEITEMLFKCGIPVAPPKLPDDARTCLFCHQMGDGVTHGPARLLNYDVNKWVHLNCALWSDEVYETTSGGLVNVEQALQNGSSVACAYCNTTGATLKCYKIRCSVVYHLPCAVKDQCVFYKNKTLYCSSHVPKNEKDNELTTLSVMRRVYIQRDEPRQIASIMHNTEQNNLLRVGSLTFLNVGQLLPHQLQNFHTPNYIYPIGYKILRMYWSMRVANRRCKYVCSIHEVEGKPEFRIIVQEKGETDLELRDSTARGVWLKVLEPMAELRKSDNFVKLFTKYISGEDLFGLTEPVVVRVLESLPGVDTLTDYKFKYGKNPFLELPLAINPTGCARSEVRPKGPGVMRKAHTQRTSSVSYRPSQSPSISIPGEPLCPYSKQFVHSKSSQYKKMKQEWRNNVYLARSKIQGLGLYAARDLEKHTMVIEYIGEIIRTEVAETREKQYEARNRGIYMFRLDEDRVVDATLSGGLARYINHSCNPNCVAETVEVERDLRIIIFTKRRINRGEELAYDYKFDIEDDQHKIPCMCGAPNCRKWMN